MKTPYETTPRHNEISYDADLDEIYDEYDTQTARLRERLLGVRRPVSDVLTENFRPSFKVSNGSAMLQFLLYAQITDTLRRHNDPGAIRDAAATTRFDPALIHLPRRHKASVIHPDTTLTDQTDALWQTCMNVVRNRDALSEITPDDEIDDDEIDSLRLAAHPDFIHLAIPLYMLQQDILYLRDGRPDRTDDKSRYRSLVRDYALLGKPTGTPELDYTTQEAGVLIRAVANPNRIVHEDFEDLHLLSNGVMDLADSWEARHKEPFFPEGTFTYEQA